MQLDKVEFGKLLLFGDSIFQQSSELPSGLAPALQNYYQRRLDVVTRGFSGYNTDWAIQMVDAVLAGLGPGPINAVVIFFGTNDAAVLGSLQHVPLDRYQDNLTVIAKAMKKVSDNVVIVGPTLVDENGTCSEAKNRKNVLQRNYSEAAKQVAQQLDVKFLDLWTIFRLHLDEDPKADKLAGQQYYDGPVSVKGLVHDGIHYSPLGYELFYKGLIKALDMPSESLPFILPSWREVEDPKSFNPLKIT